MKVLLVGNRRRLTTLLNVLENGSQGITHLADGAQAIAELSQGIRHYNWIIWEDQALQGGGKDIAAAVRGMGSYSQSYSELGEAPHLHSEPALADRSRCCGVEWTDKGILQLYCCLQQKPPVDASSANCDTLAGFVFEYHAPCRK